MKTYDISITEQQRRLLEQSAHNLSVAMRNGTVKASENDKDEIAALSRMLEADSLVTDATNCLWA